MSKGKNCIIEYERNNWEMLRIIPFGFLCLLIGWSYYLEYPGNFNTYIFSGVYFAGGLVMIMGSIYKTVKEKVKVKKKVKIYE